MTNRPVVFPPMPDPDEVSAFFWDGVAEHRLLVARCDVCGWYVHPPTGTCPKCLSTSLTPTEVSGRATLVTWAQPFKAHDAYFQSIAPYVVGVVNLEQEPLRFVSNVVECDESELRIDMPLVVTFRELAPGCTLPQFRPAS
jgi:uncharacterized OB-fold protein